MDPLMSKIINTYQLGFLPNRFIAENGLAVRLIMEQAQLHQRPGIGLLLDQEKAHDRVHPVYIQKKTMLAFGFLSQFVFTIMGLFFHNYVRININGFFLLYNLQDTKERQAEIQKTEASILVPLAIQVLHATFAQPTDDDSRSRYDRNIGNLLRQLLQDDMTMFTLRVTGHPTTWTTPR
ncbi:uncharacterized protein BX664DRAFT_131217 [Halteromyces radiatus]|uniref:uncharacterized protein n=1 Tax=Halteromyces radiatus TaxID=101107 RepID=UPI00221F2541|nr:uncharacterized protein BX664DRAFT_131217 [Halteromyces radiatus]KAI8089298.1 hypothetical protein BX664DRAFT_131217 [Halteromyces radiatus]